MNQAFEARDKAAMSTRAWGWALVAPLTVLMVCLSFQDAAGPLNALTAVGLALGLGMGLWPEPRGQHFELKPVAVAPRPHTPSAH